MPFTPEPPDRAAGVDVFEAWACPDRYAGADAPGTVQAVPGTLPVLLTAPHAAAHTRAWGRKGADVATGGLALTAALTSSAHALVATGFQTRDSNRVGDGPFKAALAAQIRRVCTVIDVHGMRATGNSDFGEVM